MTSPKLKRKTLQIWYCPECHTGDPPLTKMPKQTVADVWGTIDIVASACKAGYRSVMSMHSAPNSSIGELGSGWYLPPVSKASHKQNPVIIIGNANQQIVQSLICPPCRWTVQHWAHTRWSQRQPVRPRWRALAWHMVA